MKSGMTNIVNAYHPGSVGFVASCEINDHTHWHEKYRELGLRMMGRRQGKKQILIYSLRLLAFSAALRWFFNAEAQKTQRFAEDEYRISTIDYIQHRVAECAEIRREWETSS